MKVLHLDSGRTMRGGQIQVMRLLEGLENLGWEQMILAQGQLQSKVGAGPFKLSTIYEQAGKADLIHAHDAHSHSIAALLRRGRPLTVSRRVGFPLKTGPLTRMKYAQVSRFLAVSDYVKKVLTESGIAENRIDVVYDGVDIPEQEPEWTPPQETPRAAVLESADRLKRTAETIESCRLAGFEPFVDRNLERALERSDVFVYMPTLEGLGSAVLAAAVRKKPVVAAAVGGIPEVIVDEETGLLTDGSIEQAAAALKRLGRDESLARRLAENAFEQLAARFSSDIMVNRTAEIYRSLLHR